MEFFKSGIVTLGEYLLTSNGLRATYFWCANWKIITDKTVPVEKFRSSERWQLLALVKGKVVAIIPGCQVKGFLVCVEKPTAGDCYCFE